MAGGTVGASAVARREGGGWRLCHCPPRWQDAGPGPELQILPEEERAPFFDAAIKPDEAGAQRDRARHRGSGAD